MIAVLAYNAYGIMKVGVERADTMQWIAALVMLVFVVWRIIRMASARR
jgi:hypothetical protein